MKLFEEQQSIQLIPPAWLCLFSTKTLKYKKDGQIFQMKNAGQAQWVGQYSGVRISCTACSTGARWTGANDEALGGPGYSNEP